MPELPSGLNWADGLEGRLGTASTAGSVLVVSNAETTTEYPIEEEAGYPVIERAEQATITHRFTMGLVEGLTRLASLGRGTLLEDSYGNRSKVMSARLTRQKAGYCTLEVVSEATSFDAPPDEFSVVPVELNISILKHPRYFYAFLGEGQGSATELANQAVINLLQHYMENPNAAYRDACIRLLQDSINNVGAADDPVPVWSGSSFTDGVLLPGTELAKRAAMEIVQKYWRGEETPYIVGFHITWVRYYFRPQYVDPGGRIEDPITEASPQLPDYFYSPTDPPSEDSTIFDELAWRNPQSYSDDGTEDGDVTISWLRKADQVDWQRTWFRHERQWDGTVIGYWDSELYNRGARPTEPDDYLVINVPGEAS